MIQILVVEDEPRLRADLVDYLSMRGFAVRGADSAARFHALLQEALPDVVLMDVGLPDGNGFDLAAKLRANHDCGIIMLTAHGGSDARIRGFESGADIYLVKHSPLKEIEAAILSLCRRLRRAAPPAAPTAAWRLDPKRWVILSPEGHSITLTSSELAFLNMLMRQDGEPCGRAELATAVARPQTSFDDRHLDAVVSRLRKKIEAETGEKSPIRAAYGIGYAFSAPAQVLEN
ncbi:MAG: response regulator transcription factor [Novosphingobium sp.]